MSRTLSTKKNLSKKIRRLPVTDRIQLLDELWFSIAADQEEIPVPDTQKAMIDARLEEIEKHPGRGIPLQEFRKKLHQVAERLKTKRRKST